MTVFAFGHLHTVARSGLFPTLDLAAGDRVLALLAPDVISCHDWAYEEVWRDGDDPVTRALMRAHLIGDAVVHHGPHWTPQRRRIGWAYRNMGIIAREYEPFFAEAAANGWLLDPDAPRDHRRGWSHTLVEYAIDQYLCDTLDLSEAYSAVVAAFESVDTVVDVMAAELAASGIVPSKPFPEQPRRYAHAVLASTEPDEFHLLGIAAKFGLVETQEVVTHLRATLRRIVATLGADEFDRVVDLLIEVTADPLRHGYPSGGLVALDLPLRAALGAAV